MDFLLLLETILQIRESAVVAIRLGIQSGGQEYLYQDAIGLFRVW